MRALRFTLFFRFIVCLVTVTFSMTLFMPPRKSYAQVVAQLPVPGVMVSLSTSFRPPVIKGVVIHPDNPFRFNFVVNQGEKALPQEKLKADSTRLIKYFLAALTLPDTDLWVNLSPYEKERIIPENFGLTEMGRDLLSQDYLLKQLMSSLTYPESGLGQRFWRRVYKKAYELYGTTSIPLNTFNKVWIIPEKAVVFEKGNTAFVVESRLKVMMAEDYLALKKNFKDSSKGTDRLLEHEVKEISNISSEIAREVLIPEIEKEVNDGQNFACLRQVYHSLILATWYKRSLKESLLNEVYSNQGKIAGIDVSDKEIKQKIYEKYIEAFKEGVYNLIKEDYDENSQEVIARRYFSGGMEFNIPEEVLEVLEGDQGLLSSSQLDDLMSTKDTSTNVDALLRKAPDGVDGPEYEVGVLSHEAMVPVAKPKKIRLSEVRKEIIQSFYKVTPSAIESESLPEDENGEIKNYYYNEDKEVIQGLIKKLVEAMALDVNGGEMDEEFKAELMAPLERQGEYERIETILNTAKDNGYAVDEIIKIVTEAIQGGLRGLGVYQRIKIGLIMAEAQLIPPVVIRKIIGKEFLRRIGELTILAQRHTSIYEEIRILLLEVSKHYWDLRDEAEGYKRTSGLLSSTLNIMKEIDDPINAGDIISSVERIESEEEEEVKRAIKYFQKMELEEPIEYRVQESIKVISEKGKKSTIEKHERIILEGLKALEFMAINNLGVVVPLIGYEGRDKNVSEQIRAAARRALLPEERNGKRTYNLETLLRIKDCGEIVEGYEQAKGIDQENLEWIRNQKDRISALTWEMRWVAKGDVELPSDLVEQMYDHHNPGERKQAEMEVLREQGVTEMTKQMLTQTFNGRNREEAYDASSWKETAEKIREEAYDASWWKEGIEKMKEAVYVASLWEKTVEKIRVQTGEEIMTPLEGFQKGVQMVMEAGIIREKEFEESFPNVPKGIWEQLRKEGWIKEVKAQEAVPDPEAKGFGKALEGLGDEQVNNVSST